MSRCALLAAPLLALAACASDEPDPTDVGSLAGTYYGDLTIGHNDPLRSVFASSQLTVAPSGDLGGSTFTTKVPTDPVGEVGAGTGMIEPSGGTSADAMIELSFPTLGTFTASGTIMHFAGTGQMAGMLIARDGSGTVIGSMVLNLQQDLAR